MQDSFADAASDQEKKASYFMVPRAKITNEPGAPKVTVIRSYGSQRVVFSRDNSHFVFSVGIKADARVSMRTCGRKLYRETALFGPATTPCYGSAVSRRCATAHSIHIRTVSHGTERSTAKSDLEQSQGALSSSAAVAGVGAPRTSHSPRRVVVLSSSGTASRATCSRYLASSGHGRCQFGRPRRSRGAYSGAYVTT